MFCASGRDDRGSKGLRDLHGCQSDASCCCVDEDVITCFYAGSGNQGAVARRRRDEEACGFEERPVWGNRVEGLLPRADSGRVAALGGSEYAVPDGILGLARIGQSGG